MCSGGTGTGEVKSLNDAEGMISFTGCEFSKLPCTTKGDKSGEIVTEEVTVLAVLEKKNSTENEPALLWKPLKEVNFECTSLQKLKVTNTSGTFGGLLV